MVVHRIRCRNLRELEGGQLASVVLLTADDSDTLQQRAFEAGVTDILRKAGSEHLQQALKTFIERIQRRMQGHVLYVEDSRSVAQLTMSYLVEAGLDALVLGPYLVVSGHRTSEE